jgi:hypothetical protein
MSVVISSGLVLAPDPSGIDGNNPLIGWRNLVTPAAVAGTSQAAGFPASNLANPSTNLRWQAASGTPDQYVTVTVNSVEAVDYVGIARHNFGSGQIPVSIEGRASSGLPEVWVELVAPVLLPNDGPALFRFAPQSLFAVRVRLQPGLAVPTAAVAYVGKLLVLQRRIYVGHTPINYGRTARITNARSENGAFLGRIVLSEQTQTKVDLQNLLPDWYRANMEPFIRASKDVPFFFAWRPQAYPHEVGYAWMTNDPQPANARSNGMMQVSLELGGIT